jgi:putative hydroxymethylpyrimidine transporter CytX
MSGKANTSVFSNALIWLGASICITEMMAGTLFAPLGFAKGILALVIGHVLGCVLLYLAGWIGAKEEKSSMETTKFAFGQRGSYIFSVCNVLQLVGWTAVMIVVGSQSASTLISLGGEWVWDIIIAVLLLVWIAVGIKNVEKLNVVAIAALFVLTVVLCVVIVKSPVLFAEGTSEAVSFGAAVELSVAMPISWLPLIADYTREAEKPRMATVVSVIVYFLGSCWMYIIGMGAALVSDSGDIATILLQAGMGIVGILIVLFSTVTTTFLDAYSAGVSLVNIFKRIDQKKAALGVVVIGLVLAIFTDTSAYEDFLTLISSVFVPMIALLITDYYILKTDRSAETVDWVNVILWAVGVVLYQLFLAWALPIGSTIPVVIVLMLLSVIVHKIAGPGKQQKSIQ